MGRLFIANGTHQKQKFYYRVPEITKLMHKTIEVGGQITVSGQGTGGEISEAAINSVIAQHEKYNMISYTDISKDLRHAALAYKIGQPFTSGEINALVQRNRGVLVVVGEQTRADAAVALANDLGKSARTAENELDHVEMSITEETNKGAAPKDDAIIETRTVGREDRINSGKGKGNARRGR